MQSSQIPYKFQEIWAAAAGVGYITSPIPDTSTGANASQHLGFPPITATPIGSGGIPPNIGDFNGAFQYVTKWLQWVQAGGGIVPYDSTLQTNIGGYPKGALVFSATTAGLVWMSTAENNATNPDTGGAGWVAFAWQGGTQVYNAPGTYTFIVPAPVLYVEVWGGGGGGSANGVNGIGGSGGGGAYGYKRLTGQTVGASITVTIPAAALGGAVGGNNNGAAGGTCTFGALMSVAGGSGGTALNNNGTFGGAAPTGVDVAIAGGTAMGSAFSGAVPIGRAGDAPRGGSGGIAALVLGQTGMWPGGGGGVGASTVANSGGGNGAAGGVVVRW